MITYTLEELYQLRASPLTSGPLPEHLQALLQPGGKVCRWNTNRRHENGKAGATPPAQPAAPPPKSSPHAEAKSPQPVSPVGHGNAAVEAEPPKGEGEPPTAPLPPAEPAPLVEDAQPSAPLLPPPTAVDLSPLEYAAAPPASVPAPVDVPPIGWGAPTAMASQLQQQVSPHVWGNSRQFGVPMEDELGFDEWDSPLPSSGAAADIENYTLGDIRLAEAAVEGLGVPLQVYIDRVKRLGGADAGVGAASLPPVQQQMPAANGHHSLLGSGRQDIFFSEHEQPGESKFMTFFERNRRNVAEDSRLNGNATPFYPSRYSPEGYDDPRKYAPFLPQASSSAAARARPAMNPHAQPQNQRDVNSLLMRLARQQQQQQQGAYANGVSHPAAHPYYEASAPPPPHQQVLNYAGAGGQQQLPPFNKVTPQQLLQVIQSMSKNQNQELNPRQKDLLRFAMAKISQIQAAQQQQQQGQGPMGMTHPPKMAQAPPAPVYHHAPGLATHLPPPQQQQQQQRMPPVGCPMSLPSPSFAKHGGAPAFSDRELQPSDKITAIADALQKTLQQQKARGITPTANQKAALVQVLNALQRLKAQKNAAAAAQAPPPADLYGSVYAAAAAARKNTDTDLRKENVGIDD